MVPAMAAYNARYPEVTIDLIVSNHYADLVGEGIDLAVRVGELRDSSLVVRRFFTSALGLWAAPACLAAHPPIASLAELSRHGLIRLQTGRRGMVLQDGEDRLALDDVPGSLRVDDMRTCQALAEAGLGIALLPLFSQAPAGDARLVRVLPQISSPEFPVQFRYPRQNLVPPIVRSFIDVALNTVRV